MPTARDSEMFGVFQIIYDILTFGVKPQVEERSRGAIKYSSINLTTEMNITG